MPNRHFIGTEEEFLATFGQPMTTEEQKIADDAVMDFMFPTLNGLYPRHLTIEEMAQMETLTADLDAQLAALLKDRPRRSQRTSKDTAIISALMGTRCTTLGLSHK